MEQHNETNDLPKIGVMLVDDHPMVRSGLSAFLLAYPDLVLVGEAANGIEAVQRCEQVKPDVILMDLIMPGMDGATATRKIRERHPNIQVIILTSFKEENLVQDALKAGAIGYLLKDVKPRELVHAIRAAYHGSPTLAPEAAQALIHAATRPETPPLGHDLTERELDVLAALLHGWDNNKIAESLNISRSTVKFHVSNILSKLNATSRTEAVAIALQHNLIEKPEQ
jgi:NarL family two-component system response regulator LiaR